MTPLTCQPSPAASVTPHVLDCAKGASSALLWVTPWA